MQTFAVTGHTGFIGKKLVSQLIKLGYKVSLVDKNFNSVQCERVYHLACPSSTKKILSHPNEVMDTIIDGTRKALKICPSALFVNASSVGAEYVDEQTPQGGYNVAKRCMETYLNLLQINYKNYRIPSVYGEGMHEDSFIRRCIDGKAYRPTEPEKKYYIAHVDDVVDALIELKPINIEETTLGKIYEQFNFGRRRLHRSTFSS
jgi:nucleoside-diphosphate-sugar epimerase